MCGRVLCTLREAEHIRAGRKAIIDLQSVKTTLKGGNVDLMQVRKSKIASNTLQ